MNSVNFKAKPGRDRNLAKITMVLFKTGYARVSKVIGITGLFKDWDEVNQKFTTNSSCSAAKNAQLLEIRMKYLRVVEDWEKEGRVWNPVQWSHCFDAEETAKEEFRLLTIAQMIEVIIRRATEKKRLKNSHIVTSDTARTYKDVHNTLALFTRQKYNRNFNTYHFTDITEGFLNDYVFFLKQRGRERGNAGRVPARLKTFCGVFYYAHQLGMPGARVPVFDCVRLHMKEKPKPPRTIPVEVMERIECLDRSLFSARENLYIDLFLFTFYAGGIAPIDLAHLTWDCIREDMIIYERMKVSKEARMPFLDKARRIADKYREDCCGNYVLPVFTAKQVTERQKKEKLHRTKVGLNRTLHKIAGMLDYEGKITWYSARGTFITKMVNLDYNAADIAIMAGNSVTTIFNSYFKPSDTDTVRSRLNRAF